MAEGGSFAPSEEMILHCDVPGCPSQLSMIAGIPRAEHRWGRVTMYETAPELPWGDYDLCSDHFKALQAVLRGQ